MCPQVRVRFEPKTIKDTSPVFYNARNPDLVALSPQGRKTVFKTHKRQTKTEHRVWHKISLSLCLNTHTQWLEVCVCVCICEGVTKDDSAFNFLRVKANTVTLEGLAVVCKM